MVLTIVQAQTLLNCFNHLKKQLVQMADANDVISPFERNTNPGYPMGLKLYLQENKEIDKETEKLDILV